MSDMQEPAKPAPQTNEQKMEAVKGMLRQQLNGVHKQIVNFVLHLPIDEVIKGHAIMNLDQGAMWADQGILKLNFTVEDMPPPAPENPDTTQPPTAPSANEGA